MLRESGTTLELMRLLVENIEAAKKGAGGRIDSLKKDLRGNMINVNQSLKLKVFQETACDSYNIPFYIQIRFHLYFNILQITGHCQVLSHV